ncbi:MAG: hypothetical protein IJ115_07160 [Erysipelotrichaceae bacterium]|nr:hypothetical protein [Erysipelotrichaceae bacterium]
MVEYNEYERFLNELVYYFNPCRTEQLKRALIKNFANLSNEEAMVIITKYQNDGRILLSSDGWAMSKGKYVQMTKDSKYEEVDVNAEVRLPEMGRQIHACCNNKYFRLLDCFWVLIDMLPDSIDFSLTNKPFQLTFVAQNSLFQVISIPEDEEDLRCDMLKSLPTDYYESFKIKVKRIVLMQNPDHYWKLPENIGIKFIATVDDSKANHLRITKRIENNW